MYDVLSDVALVEEILQMTFPFFKDQNAGMNAMMFQNKGGAGSASQQRRREATGPEPEFWTNELVRSFMRRQGGQNQQYD